MNRPQEQCDGADSAACPGGCLADCTCAPPAAVVDADASVNAAKPTKNYGKKTLLEMNANPLSRAFLRIRVSGVGARRVGAAHLLLQAVMASKASSASGGRLRSVTNCAWNELAVTWKTQPIVDGALVAQAGAVRTSAPGRPATRRGAGRQAMMSGRSSLSIFEIWSLSSSLRFLSRWSCS